MNLQQYISVGQTRSLYQGLVANMIGNIGISLISIYVLWGVFEHSHLLLWFAAVILISLIRWSYARHYDAERLDENNSALWLRRATIWSGITGLNWGLISVLFFDSSQPTYVLFITCLYAGYTSASMASNSSYFPAFIAFAVPTSLLFSIQMFRQGGPVYIPLGIVVLFYIVMLSLFARRAHNFFIKATELNFRNMELMDEVISQKETAEQAVHAKNQFLASASHDLRQPLHAMNLFIDALEPLQGQAKGVTILAKIRQSMRGLNGMLHGLLDISRLDTSTVKNHPEHHNLNQIVDQLCHEYQQASDKIEISGDLGSDFTVYADATLVQRIVRNLLDNAVKYTSAGRVWLSAEQDASNVTLQINDTGIGVPPDQQQNIFDEFHQLNNPERDRQKGLGLGLAIVKRLCRLTDIQISLSSQPGTGTTVRLKIPSGNPGLVKSYTQQALRSLAGLNVLVVDDEQDILDGMEHLLSEWQCSVQTATDGAQALQKATRGNGCPNLVIADFRLRDEENGLELIEQIREEFNKDIPAILITGDTAPDRIREAHASGISILYKPVESADLREEIQRLLVTDY